MNPVSAPRRWWEQQLEPVGQGGETAMGAAAWLTSDTKKRLNVGSGNIGGNFVKYVVV